MVEGPASRFATGRFAGALVPLFSISSRGSWGIGEIADLPRLARWLESSGLSFVQLLPVNEMAEGQNSPYSALSAMAIDPLFIALDEVPEFVDAGGEAALADHERRLIEKARASAAVDYCTVRSLKSGALGQAFARFDKHEWQSGSSRAKAFSRFLESERWWIDDYALFRALHADQGGRPWTEWERDVRDRDPGALDTTRIRIARAIRYYAWLQWIADEQWQHARRDCGSVGIFGDFPFVVSADSADVWSRQSEFRVDVSVGVPPDAFSETGQDWGLPAYRWDVIESGGDEWLRERARRCADLYDGFRIDHLVGFYRTFVREQDGRMYFVPSDEPSQLAQGERVMAHLAESGARLIAEDLGTIPDFVRESLSRLGLPGMKVLRWERKWDVEGQPFRDPAHYPSMSVATSGTHDTEPLAAWWDSADVGERRCVDDIPALRAAGCSPEDPFSPRLRDAFLSALFGAGSDMLLLPVQDIFGWRERINTPAVVDDVNWTWRLPWLLEEMTSHPGAQERASFLRALARKYGRLR